MDDRSNQGTESDDLGRFGESEFDRWCASLRWIANRANVDRRGFDFLVHVPFDVLPGSSVFQRDLLPREEHLAAVQIKATGKGRAPAASLTVLRHLMDHPGPAFIVILDVDSACLPWSLKQAYLLHLDSQWVADIAKRLWELDAEASTSKVLVPLPFDRAVKLTPPDASGLQKAIQGLNLSDPTAYVRSKVAAKESAGRRPRPFVASITFRRDSAGMAEVADWSVGKTTRARLPAESLQLFEERFGKRLPLGPRKHDVADHLELEVRDSPGVEYGQPCWIEFLQAGTSRRARIPATIYSSRHRAPFLPTELERVRIAAPGVEIMLQHDAQGAPSLSCEFGLPDDGSALRGCLPTAQVISLFENDARVHLRISEPGSSTDFIRLIDNVRVSFPARVFRIASGLPRAHRIALLAGLGDEFPVYFVEIEQQADALRLIDGMPWYDEASGTWMAVNPVGEFRLQDDKPLTVLIPWIAVLGRNRIMALVAFEGTFVLTSGSERGVATRNARSRLVRAYVVGSDPGSWLADFRDAVNETTTALETDGHLVLAPRVDDVIDEWLRSLSLSLPFPSKQSA